MSPAPRTLQPSAKGDKTTLYGVHFAVVSVKLDLSSTESWLDKEKDNFYFVNTSVYVTPTVQENCALLIFVY